MKIANHIRERWTQFMSTGTFRDRHLFCAAFGKSRRFVRFIGWKKILVFHWFYFCYFWPMDFFLKVQRTPNIWDCGLFDNAVCADPFKLGVTECGRVYLGQRLEMEWLGLLPTLISIFPFHKSFFSLPCSARDGFARDEDNGGYWCTCCTEGVRQGVGVIAR